MFMHETEYADQSAIEVKVREANHGMKIINGHDPDYVAKSFGLSEDELFPPDGLTLYVGCPWQKLDRKGVVIIDYEFGPVAEFQTDKSVFLDRLLKDFRIASDEINVYNSPTPDDKDPLAISNSFLIQAVPQARELINRVRLSDLRDCSSLSNEFFKLQADIEETFRQMTEGKGSDPLDVRDDRLIALWYFAVHGQRVYDLYDWEKYVKPKLDRLAHRLDNRNLSPDQKNAALLSHKRTLIEKIRLQKTATKAEVVEAMFPNLPFRDGTFDSFVAYYSISTYVVPHLNQDDLMKYWHEIYRVIKKGGMAYVGPIFSGNDDLIESTLHVFQDNHPGFEYDLDSRKDFLYINKK
jgi:SAM-dependent methyltransferase